MNHKKIISLGFLVLFTSFYFFQIVCSFVIFKKSNQIFLIQSPQMQTHISQYLTQNNSDIFNLVLENDVEEKEGENKNTEDNKDNTKYNNLEDAILSSAEITIISDINITSYPNKDFRIPANVYLDIEKPPII